MDFPNTLIAPVVGTISTASPAVCITAQTGVATGGTFTGTAAWGTNNRAIYVMVTVETTVTAYQMAWINGATLGGNVDVGIYDALGTRLVNKGSTAQSGASTEQVVDITDTVLTPGVYYLALACDLSTATFQRISSPTGVPAQACGAHFQDTAFTLPSTATFATGGASILPIIAAATKAAI